MLKMTLSENIIFNQINVWSLMSSHNMNKLGPLNLGWHELPSKLRHLACLLTDLSEIG